MSHTCMWDMSHTCRIYMSHTCRTYPIHVGQRHGRKDRRPDGMGQWPDGDWARGRPAGPMIKCQDHNQRQWRPDAKGRGRWRGGAWLIFIGRDPPILPAGRWTYTSGGSRSGRRRWRCRQIPPHMGDMIVV